MRQTTTKSYTIEHLLNHARASSSPAYNLYIGCKMDKRVILDKLLGMYEAYYDVIRDHEFKGRVFEGYAEFHSESSQYVLSKRAKLWGANTHEYVFIKMTDHLDKAGASGLVDFITGPALEKVRLNPEHMTSLISLIVISEGFDDEAALTFRKLRFRKNHMLGLRGWSDVRCALADLSDCRIITNRQGEEIAHALRRCFEKGTR